MSDDRRLALVAAAATAATAGLYLYRRASNAVANTCAAPAAAGTSYFLSGVMGGSGGGGASLAGIAVESQDYRAQMRDAVLAADSNANIIDPAVVVADLAPRIHAPGTPEAAWWAEDEAVRSAFGACVELAARSDVVISYLPTASMGSAVELHAARAAHRLVLVVAPGKMSGNWVVRAYADHVFEDVDALRAWLQARASKPSSRPSCAQAPSVAAAPLDGALDGSITFLYSDLFGRSGGVARLLRR